LNPFNGVESRTIHLKLQFGEEEKVTMGKIGWGWGTTVMFFLDENVEILKDL
jgi:hypothetical protein